MATRNALRPSWVISTSVVNVNNKLYLKLKNRHNYKLIKLKLKEFHTANTFKTK